MPSTSLRTTSSRPQKRASWRSRARRRQRRRRPCARARAAWARAAARTAAATAAARRSCALAGASGRATRGRERVHLDAVVAMRRPAAGRDNAAPRACAWWRCSVRPTRWTALRPNAPARSRGCVGPCRRMCASIYAASRGCSRLHMPGAVEHARMQEALRGGRHHARTRADILGQRQLRVGAAEIAGAVVDHAMTQDQVLRTGGRAHRIDLHEAELVDGLEQSHAA